jgi:transcriptional regulator with XRE-family HTH domain
MRENAGLSQRDLAQRLKVPHSWVAKVETGERRIDLVEFAWVASACRVAPLEVLERLLRKFATPARHALKGGRVK